MEIPFGIPIDCHVIDFLYYVKSVPMYTFFTLGPSPLLIKGSLAKLILKPPER